MLDKSIPYNHMIMKMRLGRLACLEEPATAPGYSLRFFKDGDEQHWARLEASVLEFADEEKALAYFTENYSGPYREELYRRCVFAVDENDVPVATATGWFMDSSMGRNRWLQWISTDPAHQGKGLGRAVITKALLTYRENGPEGDIFLHTQTWSHKAAYLYHKVGFNLFIISHLEVPNPKGPEPLIMHNEPGEALRTLRQVYSPELIQELRDSAEWP